jgi:hypothetical protein
MAFDFNMKNHSWFKCKFTKAQLSGKKIAFHVPGDKIVKIGELMVRDNPCGELFIQIQWVGLAQDGSFDGIKMPIGQNWIHRIQVNSDSQIPADFIIPPESGSEPAGGK